ncbi:MAG: hypothetical protein HGB26_03010 [Desulfobulbaceae bacterium]|nr:hypothetical protein [Desulfobulbaceae bacterium]
MSDKNPFLHYDPVIGREVGVCSVADMIETVNRSINPTWIRLVISRPGMQSTVVKAAEVRLRKLGYKTA